MIKAKRVISRGDVFWLQLDKPDASTSNIPHPYVVIQEDIFNRSRVSTVIVCALSSNLRRASEPGNVLLAEGEGDLPRRSVLVVSQVASVPRDQLGAHIGALSQRRVDQILAGMRFQQASGFTR